MRRISGRCQRGIRYALWALGEATTVEILEYCYPLAGSRPAVGERWDSRLVATAAEDGLIIRVPMTDFPIPRNHAAGASPKCACGVPRRETHFRNSQAVVRNISTPGCLTPLRDGCWLRAHRGQTHNY